MAAPRGWCTWISMEHWASVLCHGQFPAEEADVLRETLGRLVSPSGIVRVDLHGVTHLGRSAVVALVDVGRIARHVDCELTVVAPAEVLGKLRGVLGDGDRELLGLPAVDGA